jgi:hypothetical protein
MPFFAIFVQGNVPEKLMAICVDEERYPALIVHGDGYFGGAEYMFKNDQTMLNGYPRMMEKVEVPEGTYSARVYRVAHLEGICESWTRERFGVQVMRLTKLHSVLTACSVIGAIGLVVSFVFVTWTEWLHFVGGTIGCAVTTLALRYTEGFRAMAGAWNEFRQEYPDYVVLE